MAIPLMKLYQLTCILTYILWEVGREKGSSCGSRVGSENCS